MPILNLRKQTQIVENLPKVKNLLWQSLWASKDLKIPKESASGPMEMSQDHRCR